jgi:hypothetical protein
VPDLRNIGGFHKNCLFPLVVLHAFFLLTGCNASPSKSEVARVITNYFEEKHYMVIGIDVRDIQPVPLGEKTYMGTEGYIVDVRSITLEVTEDIGAPWSYKKGQRLTFRNAVVRVREQPGQKGKWVISNISGIPVR